MSKSWYIVHAYSNFEKKVAESIKERAVLADLESSFEEIIVPTEKVIEIKRGRYGFYVTDGKVNISLKNGEETTITLDEAIDKINNKTTK